MLQLKTTGSTECQSPGSLIYKLLDRSLPMKYKSPARLHSESLGAIIAGKLRLQRTS
ncbi:hypothetical protein V1506DRAFT_545734 [Lipomyces tetrasporus]